MYLPHFLANKPPRGNAKRLDITEFLNNKKPGIFKTSIFVTFLQKGQWQYSNKPQRGGM